MSQQSDHAAIPACIKRCAELPTERGRWQAEDRCAAALHRPGTSGAIADACAAAARRVGALVYRLAAAGGA